MLIMVAVLTSILLVGFIVMSILEEKKTTRKREENKFININ